LLDEYVRGATSVLDLGCGFGVHTATIANRIAPIAVGLDLNDIKLREARRIASTEGVTENTAFVCGDAAHPPFRPAGFQCILATEVLEHLINPSEGLAACNRLLCDHGLLILTTPSRHNLDYIANPFFILEKVLSLIWNEVLPPYHNLHAEREFDWRKPEPLYGMHYHFSWGELERLFRENGFEVVWKGGFEMEVFPFLILEFLARGNLTQIRKVVAPMEAALERIPVIRAMGQHLLAVARKIRTL
jgi:SAM-dependent methyltransferase